MHGLAIFSLVLGLLAALAFLPPSGSSRSEEGLALNFGQFRHAAWIYADAHPSHAGPVTHDLLDLDPLWHDSRDFSFFMEDGRAYVYAHAAMEEAMGVKRRLGNSMAIGYARNGLLLPAGIPLSSQVPDGVVVSLMEVTP